MTKFADIHECLLQSSERCELGTAVQLATGTSYLSVNPTVVHGRVPHRLEIPCPMVNIYITIPASHESAQHRTLVRRAPSQG
jgi:hypothetical protein